ncbi:MAG: hypothetical protein V1895_00765 [Parcubacteria group bacterium]
MSMSPQAQLATKVELKRAIRSVERRINYKINKQTERHNKIHDKIIENIQMFADHFDGKIDRVETSLHNRIDAVEHNLGNRIKESESRVEAKLGKKIDEAVTSILGGIETLLGTNGSKLAATKK